MKGKLKLDLESLKVESFETSGGSDLDRRGTVHGYTNDGADTCLQNQLCGYPETQNYDECSGALGCGGGGNDTEPPHNTDNPGSVYCYSYAAPCRETGAPAGQYCTQYCPEG